MYRSGFFAIALSMLSTAAAYGQAVFEDTVLFGPSFTNRFGEEVFFGESLNPGESISWGHSTPLDFAIPPDTVNEAILELEATFVDELNNEVEVSGIFTGNLDQSGAGNVDFSALRFGGAFFRADGTTAFNLSNALTVSGWPLPGGSPGDPLNVTLNASDRYGMRLISSTFHLDYTNGPSTGGSAPLPAGAAAVAMMGAAVAMVRRKLR